MKGIVLIVILGIENGEENEEHEESIMTEMNQVQAPKLIEEAILIVEHMGENVTFGREYKDDKMRIMAHHGWSSGTLKIEYKGDVILHQRFGQTHRSDHADPHPHILTYLYRPDSALGWYEHLQAVFEAAKRRADEG